MATDMRTYRFTDGASIRSLSGPDHKFEREELLNEVYAVTAVNVTAGVVYARSPRGWWKIETRLEHGCKLVWFTLTERGRSYRFWYNASSVRDLGQRLRALPRVSFREVVTA